MVSYNEMSAPVSNMMYDVGATLLSLRAGSSNDVG